MTNEKPFREPKIIEMCREGDYRRFLCIAELNLGEITGGIVKLSYPTEFDSVAWCRALEAAWRRAAERAEAKEWLPAGSIFEDFR